MSTLLPGAQQVIAFNLADNNRLRQTNWWFVCCVAIVLSISTYDTYLVAAHKQHIQQLEKNPICLALIQLDVENLSFFMLGKLGGNLMVIIVLFLLRRFEFKHYLIVAFGVAAFQLTLLLFLEFSDPVTGFLYFDDLFIHRGRPASDAYRNLAYHLVGLTGGAGFVFACSRLVSVKRVFGQAAAP